MAQNMNLNPEETMKTTISLWTLHLLLIFGFTNPSFANSGTVGGGGGDPLAIQFQKAALRAIDNIEKNKTPTFSKIILKKLRTKVRSAFIMVVDQLPATRLKDVTQNSAVINYPDENLLLIRRQQYKDEIANTEVEEAFALHEYLSLMRLERTGKYPFSGLYNTNNTEKVISFDFHEEIGCALTNIERLLCFASRNQFYFANAALLNPPHNLIKPTEVAISLSTGCVSTQLGIKCWGRHAELVETKSKNWKHPRSLNLEVFYNSEGKYVDTLCAITDDGPLCTEDTGINNFVPTLYNVKKLIAPIYGESCALADDTISCWGRKYNTNSITEIPQGLGQIKDVSFAPGKLSACAISENRGLSCWGFSIPPFLKELLVDGSLENPTDYQKLYLSADELCAIKPDGIFRCWGVDHHDVDYIPTNTGAVADIKVSGTNKCVVNFAGKLRCWSVHKNDVNMITLRVPSEIRY